jgi:drug/metabolite transporter (DMT)-like permease
MKTIATTTTIPGRSRSLTVLYCKLTLTAVFWGGTFVAGRLIAREAAPFSAAFLRFAVASSFLLSFVFRVHGRFPGIAPRQLPALVLLGLTGILAYNFFFFSGLKTITASRASLIIATNPVFIALLSACFLKERLNLSNVLGIVLSVSGAAVVVSQGHPLMLLRGGMGLGELYIFGCVASWVSYSLIGKKAMKDLSPLLTVTYACMIGTICLLFPALGEGIAGSVRNYSGVVWGGVFYLGFFGSALGFLWFYEGVKEIGPSRAGVFINIVPVSSIVLAFLFLQEGVDVSLSIGAVLILAGVYLTNARGKR